MRTCHKDSLCGGAGRVLSVEVKARTDVYSGVRLTLSVGSGAVYGRRTHWARSQAVHATGT